MGIHDWLNDWLTVEDTLDPDLTGGILYWAVLPPGDNEKDIEVCVYTAPGAGYNPRDGVTLIDGRDDGITNTGPVESINGSLVFWVRGRRTEGAERIDLWTREAYDQAVKIMRRMQMVGSSITRKGIRVDNCEIVSDPNSYQQGDDERFIWTLQMDYRYDFAEDSTRDDIITGEIAVFGDEVAVWD